MLMALGPWEGRIITFVTSQRLELLDLSVFGYLAFKDSLPSGVS
jgi:hypothetical protein